MKLHLNQTTKKDLSASVVVFFVALPLCLGIALASGAPLFSGIIAGIVGGVVVGALSGSSLGVSGPAAGLAVIVVSSIAALGDFTTFLLAVCLAGAMQVGMGLLKAGVLAHFFPSSVVKGMLTGIGILIIWKQIPHALGIRSLDFSDLQVHLAASIVSIGGIAILLFWEKVLSKKHKIFQVIQGPLAVIALGVIVNLIFAAINPSQNFSPSQLVQLPIANSFSEFINQFVMPNFSQISNVEVWKIAAVLAVVASIETLLCVEATDKLDPKRRETPLNQELKAQGVGNMISGLLGGLPLTQVIVRSTANITFGAESKKSTIFHGVWLLLFSLFAAKWLNFIPLAALAAILIIVGQKLAKPEMFRQMYSKGVSQFTPFVATVAGVVFTDLLTGIVIGMLFGVFFTLWHSYRNCYSLKENNQDKTRVITLAEEIYFFNKPKISKLLLATESHSKVIIDFSQSKSVSLDVVEMIDDFTGLAKHRNISVEKHNFNQGILN